MTTGQAIVLGLVQGVTEFLPISSSGHLILVPHVFRWPDQGLAFDAALHLGTLAALLAYFRRELLGFVSGALSRRLLLVIAIATVPGAVAGVLFDRLIEAHVRSTLVVAASTAIWAVVLWVADRHAVPPAVQRTPRDPLERIGWARGIAVGIAQALALIPGTSRSGITITTGLFGGLDRATAARFSFLLGIPIMAGAGGFKMLHLLRTGTSVGEGGPVFVGLLTAFLSGWAAVWFLIAYLQRGSLRPFVVYRLALAAVIIAVAFR